MTARETARDADIGLNGFYTSPGPLEGRLKVRVSDFQVDEVGGRPREDPRGRFTCAIVQLTNWETNAFVRAASERLQMSRKKIHFSGTKDKRGITTRVFTFEADPLAVEALSAMPGVAIDRLYRTDQESQLGDHVANQFRIVARDIPGSASEALQRCQAVWDEAMARGGFPNFFGPQRFGAVRATTHRVGERILRGDFHGAIGAYLGSPPMGVDAAASRSWAEALGRRDYAAMLQLTTRDQGFERALLHRMVETPDDPVRALLALPKNLQLLFVSAFQSFLFNRIVSRRLALGLALHEAMEGDLVAPVEGGIVAEEWVPVSAGNLQRVNEEIRRGRAVVTAPLPGTHVAMATGRAGQIEQAVLDEEKASRSDFVVPEHPEWSSKGLRRAVLVRPDGWQITAGGDELHPGRTMVEVAFSLPRGAYATSVLREFLKAPELWRYG